MSARTFCATIRYDGTEFSGWQVQPDQRTVQGALQDAIKKATGHQVTVTGSGRTDAGVHALGQVASCRFPVWTASADALCKAINSRLDNDLVITEMIDAPPDFHAIRDAIGKRYRYQIKVRRQRDPFTHRYRWRLRRTVDIEMMQAAARRIIGHKDFASFESNGARRKSTVRDVRDCVVLMEEGYNEHGHLSVEVESNGFLYNMVRNIVGTLVEVGYGKYPPTWIDEVLAKGDRVYAGPTAPPQGLFLKEVYYEPFENRSEATITPN